MSKKSKFFSLEASKISKGKVLKNIEANLFYSDMEHFDGVAVTTLWQKRGDLLLIR